MIKQKIGLITLLASMTAGSLYANNTLTNYAVGDVLICFQGGGKDLVVDAGPISTFLGYGTNTSHPILAYTTTQVNTPAGPGIDGIQWSAFTWKADNTLYMTKPRSDVNTPTTPWHSESGNLQNNVVLRMVTIPPGAANNRTWKTQSTDTAIIEPSKSSGNPQYKLGGVSYTEALAGSYQSDWNGTFQGNPENIELTGVFSGSGTVMRSDFYQLTPTEGVSNGIFLGYFELADNGSMTYVAYPPTVPVINSITRTGNSTTITYTTGLYGTYTLLGSGDIATSLGSWTPVSGVSLLGGDSATHSVTFTDINGTKFYTIKAQ